MKGLWVELSVPRVAERPWAETTVLARTSTNSPVRTFQPSAPQALPLSVRILTAMTLSSVLIPASRTMRAMARLMVMPLAIWTHQRPG